MAYQEEYHSFQQTPGSPPRTPQPISRLPRPLSVGERLKDISNGPSSAPPLQYKTNIDAERVAMAQAAAAAAYDEAIASYSKPPPLTPDSPPRYIFGNTSSLSNGPDAGMMPSYSPPQTSQGSTSPTGSNPELKKAEPKKTSLYKTELCRSWEESGNCRYGNKCQFAHSYDEVRNLDRHPKYKTEMCKTFWERGTCPYGKRCCFIHTENAERTGNGLKPTASPFQSTIPTPFQMDSPEQADGILPKSLLDRQPSARPAALTPSRITISTTSSSDKLFDQVTNEFSLWSPSLNSPTEARAFPFPNPVTAPLVKIEDSKPQIVQSIPSSPIGRARPSASALLFLNTRDASNSSFHERSALSAGVPTTTPFFLNTSNLGTLLDEEVPMTAPASRFPPSNIFNQSSSLLSPGASSPMASQAPTRSFSVSDSIGGNSPLSASFTHFPEGNPVGKAGGLRKWDSKLF